jgi:hypothetical protein
MIPSNMVLSNPTTMRLDYYLFPNRMLVALPYTKSVSTSSPEIGWRLDFVAWWAKDVHGDDKGAQSFGLGKLSHSLIFSNAVFMDPDDERLQFSVLVIALERVSPALGGLHTLIYFEGAIVIGL